MEIPLHVRRANPVHVFLIPLVLWSLPLHTSRAQAVPVFRPLTAADRVQLSQGARLSAHHRPAAMRWLRHQRGVSQVVFAPDATTIEVRFRDGAAGVIVDITPSPHRRSVAGYRRRVVSQLPSSAASSRALVLEPFASELGLGPAAGQPEIDSLRDAGFEVDVYRDGEVTIPTIESMTSYSVVYMESHSGTCGPPLCKGTDVFVLTGVKVTGDVSAYASLFRDGSMTEGVTDTNPGTIYLAFTSRLIDEHAGAFPDSSIVFINGCDLLATPDFLQTLLAHNASSVYSWNKKVYNADAEAAADFIFPRLAAGETLSGALADARGVGLGASFAEEGTVLGLFGDRDNTFANALHHATPTPTPTLTAVPTATRTPVPTVAPTQTPTPARKTAHTKCQKGYKRVHGKCKRVKKPKSLW